VAGKLSTQGFKILLDIIASAPPGLKIVELPFTFRERLAGQSKLDSLVVLDYLGLLVAKTFGDWISVRFLMFVLVGATGVVVNVVCLLALRELVPALPFFRAQGLATLPAMVWNFFLNNRLTYRDQRLKGRAALRGLLMFCLVCSVGAIANLGVANWLYRDQRFAWLASLAGATIGAIFNYFVSSALTWRRI